MGGAGTNPGGGGGGGPIVKLDAQAPGSGGTTGGSAPCNSTSTAGCVAQFPPACGDGINNQGGIEACDDGNGVPGDGCNGVCKVEKNWTCPPDIRQGPCTRNIICGDGEIGAGEVCDDGNTLDNDGCNSTCNLQDPAFKCDVGQPCVRVSQCGNKRIEAGEDCDDGNTKEKDGCSASCKLEGGWICPTPGAPCKQAARCGDGVLQTSIGEACDDGNQKDGDGCSADCKTKSAGCVCTPGQLCVCPTVKCGNGTLEGAEGCDDGNTKPGDGCTGTCTVEKGYACPFTGAPCVSDCGDGIVLSPMEQCDPKAAGTNMDQACSSTCKYNDGWACTGSPPNCHKTVCGDGKVEGSEGCDLGAGKNVPGSGCSPTCHPEPNCSSSTGTCTSKCGDGLVVNEECDDGNTNDGDGCSHLCKVEAGFECKQAVSTADAMTVPVTYRDFLLGGDFHAGDITGSNNATTGLVKTTLDSEGKPVFAGAAGDGHITSADTFKQWYRDVAGTNTSLVSTILLHNNGQGGFVNWWKDNQQWKGYSNIRWCSDGTCSNCNTPPYVNDGTMECFAKCTPWGTGNTNSCVANLSLVDGNPLFFPVDNIAGMITPTAAYHTPAKTPPLYSSNWTDEPGAPAHNFSFTSEVRYWFSYNSSGSYTLDFTGDDDVWVFVNRTLVVDLGGIHTPVEGQLMLGATGNAAVTVTPTEGSACTTAGVVSTCTSVKSTVKLGLTNNGVYEIVVFQAERAWDGSTYKLTLSGFNDKASACGPICGDGVVSPGEQCDNGAKNLGGYNQCGTDCRLGPYCGDAKVTDPEECDNGKNNDDYGSTSGCGPDCKFPARCGDSIVQTQFDEECDEGASNQATTDPNAAYGGCTSTCKRGGRCGDGVTNGTEACDDGVNDGTYGTCNPDCTPAARCGDGTVQADYGEECEPTMSNDPNCTDACRLPGGCGDGKIQPPEQCDDGAMANNGDYGGCAPSCIYAPHCGDGVPNGPEECDDGTNDGTYGGCTPQCKLAPHCGDKIINGPEQCDDGPDNGKNGVCTAACVTIVWAPP